MEIMTRPDARGAKLEKMVDRLTDALADQFAQLTLMMKKKMKAEAFKDTYGHVEEYGPQNCF